LPVRFYCSRYPYLTVVDPHDKNRITPRQLTFTRGQFIAKEQWQVDLLRGRANVYEADSDTDLEPCPECGYNTRSIRDFQQHIKKHLS
jgi:hypothetical protein